MGNYMDKYFFEPDTTPNAYETPKFDPMLGFPNGRKARVPQASRMEMINAKIPMDLRDYCAHLLLESYKCRDKYYPLWEHKCRQEVHNWETCEYEDYVLRMKEWERERRLLRREKKMREAVAA